jgi:plasmid stabilization system protein ParE
MHFDWGFSRAGKSREDVRPGARTFSFERKITILFHVRAQQVVSLDIFYGGREISAE